METTIKEEFILRFGQGQLSPIEEWNIAQMQKLRDKIKTLEYWQAKQ